MGKISKLSPKKYSSVLPFLKDCPCFRSFAFSVLENNSQGSVFLVNDGLYLVCWKGGCYVLCGKSCSEIDKLDVLTFLSETYQHATDEIGLFVWIKNDSVEITNLAAQSKISNSKCLVYNKQDLSVLKKIMSIKSSLDCDVSLISSSHIKYLMLKNDIVSKWNSFDDFLKNGFGYIAFSNNNKLVGYCYSGAVGAGELEISVKIFEEFKNLGFGTLLGAKFCTEAYNRKLHPIWTCMKDNEPSVKLAEGLGFMNKIESSFYYRKR